MRKGRCKYAVPVGEPICKAGVRLSQVTPRPADPKGLAFRQPCTREWPAYEPETDEQKKRREDAMKEQGKCDKYTEPTAEDFKQFDEEGVEFVRRLKVLGPVILPLKKEHKGKSWRGYIKCPVCEKRLLVNLAPNGHAAVRCETEGCFNFIE